MRDEAKFPDGFLGPGLVGASRWIDDRPAPPLWSGEEVGPGAVELRRREFAFGRATARDALVALGHPEVAVVRRADRTPAFPARVAGSLTHSRTLAVAVVGWAAELRAVGVDVEPARPLDPTLVPLVATPAERARTADPEAFTRLFGVKEAAFKCWYTAGGGRIADFQEFEIDIAPDGQFAIVRQPTPIVSLTGRWARAHDHWWAICTTSAV